MPFIALCVSTERIWSAATCRRFRRLACQILGICGLFVHRSKSGDKSPHSKNLFFRRLLGLGGRALANEVLKGVLVVSGDLPNIATWVFDHPAAIAIGHVLWLFERFGSCFQRTLVCRVDIIDIEVEKCRHRIARANTAYHDERVANFDLAGDVGAKVSCRTERLLEELNQPGDVVNHEPRGHAMPTHGNRFSHRLSTPFASPRLGATGCSAPYAASVVSQE